MTTITRTNLVNDTAQATKMKKTETKQVIDALFDRLTEALENNDETRVSGFGTFSVIHRVAADGRNPQTGEKIKIAASRKVKFTSAKALKTALNPRRLVGPDRGRTEAQRRQA